MRRCATPSISSPWQGPLALGSVPIQHRRPVQPCQPGRIGRVSIQPGGKLPLTACPCSPPTRASSGSCSRYGDKPLQLRLYHICARLLLRAHLERLKVIWRPGTGSPGCEAEGRARRRLERAKGCGCSWRCGCASSARSWRSLEHTEGQRLRPAVGRGTRLREELKELRGEFNLVVHANSQMFGELEEDAHHLHPQDGRVRDHDPPDAREVRRARAEVVWPRRGWKNLPGRLRIGGPEEAPRRAALGPRQLKADALNWRFRLRASHRRPGPSAAGAVRGGGQAQEPDRASHRHGESLRQRTAEEEQRLRRWRACNGWPPRSPTSHPSTRNSVSNRIRRSR